MAYPYRRHAAAMTMDDFIAWMATWVDAEKFELHEGIPVAMAGGTVVNDTIAINLTMALGPRLRERGCRLHRDVLVRSRENDSFGAFPDLFVRCGPLNGLQTWVDDPVAVFEVLSPSTESYDRGYKLEQYKSIASIRHIGLIYPREVRVELWNRADREAWPGQQLILSRLEDQMILPSLDLSTSLGHIYEDTDMARSA